MRDRVYVLSFLTSRYSDSPVARSPNLSSICLWVFSILLLVCLFVSDQYWILFSKIFINYHNRRVRPHHRPITDWIVFILFWHLFGLLADLRFYNLWDSPVDFQYESSNTVCMLYSIHSEGCRFWRYNTVGGGALYVL